MKRGDFRMSGGHGHLDASNKKIALLIAVLALALSLAETFAKSSQTGAISNNVEASNLWAFFQAKTIRMTVVRTAVEEVELGLPAVTDAASRSTVEKRLDGWKKTAARYDSEPETGEGRKELMARALAAEKKRDRSLEKYHHFEVSSAAFQIAIVLASATVITGFAFLTWMAIGLGAIGAFFFGVGALAPSAIHLL
jgi:hypothetical protein